MILSGVIGENEKLPSVRELASTLAINPNTIQRAYRELESEGFVGSSPGKGVFAVGADALRRREVESIYEVIFSEIKKLLDYGVEIKDILDHINIYYKQKDG